MQLSQLVAFEITSLLILPNVWLFNISRGNWSEIVIGNQIAFICDAPQIPYDDEFNKKLSVLAAVGSLIVEDYIVENYLLFDFTSTVEYFEDRRVH